ncbi:nSTAND1 domain-containing NTPase [Couchioplanes azureus]|uniref:nSTAND1 domain-containing NTPase n=1 Tax=Couchioplanes caeruleus TaxID=56438 RepID=UPI00166FE79D|nr:hypothetical protein [Couchioplanes caeruleus]GGQ44542.1 hypothetical protein GCM10010166_11360 [Couchioplanes caeruleus subsp. azureus]
MDPTGGPIEQFAAGLRELRENAGRPSYRDLARRAHFSVTTLSVAAAGRQLPSLAVTLAYVEACGGDRAAWEQRWKETAAALADDADADATAAAEPPYRGLASYEPDDAEWFFGRERLVRELLDSLASRRVVAVFGASGSGKSSVLRAGVLSEVARGALGSGWPTALMTPGDDPLAELTRTLTRTLPKLAPDPATWDTAIGTALAGEPDGVELLLVVDQFEEVFTLCADDARRRAFFAAMLGAAHTPGSRVRVILGIRADFYARCAQYPELVTAFRDAQAMVGPMNAAELRDALVRPAERAGLRVEGTLVSTVVAQLANRPGALPLASHAMVQAWQRRRGTTMTLAGYEAAGGVDGAIAQSAEAVYTALGPQRQRTTRRVLLRLVDSGDDAPVTRRRVARAEFGDDPDIATVIDRLATARLLTVTRDTVEITHEALVQAWPRLRGWIDDDHEGLRLHRLLTHAAADWESLGREDSALYRGTRLARASEWRAENPDAVTAREADFLDRSLAVQSRAQATSRRRRRALLAGLVSVVVLVSALAVAAWAQAARAQRQHDLALSRQLAAQSQSLNATRPATARRLATAAWLTEPTEEARDALTFMLAQQREALVGHTDDVGAVAFSPDGTLLATGGHDRTVRLWDPATDQPVGDPFTGHTAAVTGVAFSPDGSSLATASSDATVRLWNPRTGEQTGNPLTGHTEAVTGLAFSPDGTLLATSSDDDTGRLWNARTGKPVGKPLTGHIDDVWGVAFSPDGSLLATTSSDATVRLWNPRTGEAVGKPLTGHTDDVLGVAFSPDGKLLATVSSHSVVRLWDPRTGEPVGDPLTGHTGPVTSAAFSPDGTLLATGSSDATARLWNPRTGELVGKPLTGHTEDVAHVAFSPDGKLLATASEDDTARLWDPRTGRSVGGPITGHAGPVTDVAFRPDGGLFATTSTDDTARLWNARTREPAGRPFAGHTDAVLGVAFSPDGTLLATAAVDDTARLWNARTGEPVGDPLDLHAADVLSVAFSPDGTLLATTSADGTARLWNAATGRPAGGPLTGHTDEVYGVAFSPDGRLLATTSADRTIRLWNPTTGQPVGSPLTGHNALVMDVAFSPDGKLFATTGYDRTVRLWNPATGEPVGEPLTGHTEDVWSVAFSPDGRLLATTSADRTIRLWNPTTGEPVGGPLIGHTEVVTDVAFSPDGTRLVSSSTDGTIRLWDVATYENPLRALCTRFGLPTNEEWSTYAPQERRPRSC